MEGRTGVTRPTNPPQSIDSAYVYIHIAKYIHRSKASHDNLIAVCLCVSFQTRPRRCTTALLTRRVVGLTTPYEGCRHRHGPWAAPNYCNACFYYSRSSTVFIQPMVRMIVGVCVCVSCTATSTTESQQEKERQTLRSHCDSYTLQQFITVAIVFFRACRRLFRSLL
jgi:hypothetical protein